MAGPVPIPPEILRPHEPVAERVLLPGDPGRALRLSTQLIDGPRMLNHHRGLWGYSGPGTDEPPLTIQSTGLGGPSAAAVVAELVALGARRLVRVGTGAALGATAAGAVVVVESALAYDGASRALGAGERVAGDRALTAALARAADVAPAPIASADIHDPVLAARWAAAGAVACDLTTAASTAAVVRSHATALIGITRAGGARLEGDALEALERRLGAAALAALG